MMKKGKGLRRINGSYKIVTGMRTGGKGEGIKKCKLVVTRGLWDMKYGIGSRVKNMVITVRSVGRVLDYWGDHFINHVNV